MSWSKFLNQILPVLAGLGGLIILGYFFLTPITSRLDRLENQVNNHLPSQIREIHQRLDRMDEKFDRINEQLDKIYELLLEQKKE